jgi:hypothetical protein
VDAAAPKNPKTRLRASIHTAILPAILMAKRKIKLIKDFKLH